MAVISHHVLDHDQILEHGSQTLHASGILRHLHVSGGLFDVYELPFLLRLQELTVVFLLPL